LTDFEKSVKIGFRAEGKRVAVMADVCYQIITAGLPHFGNADGDGLLACREMHEAADLETP
jgi:hypothetical protein